MLCPNCETDNEEGARFCNECGFPLSGAISRVAGAASPRAPQAEQRSPRETEDEAYAQSWEQAPSISQHEQGLQDFDVSFDEIDEFFEPDMNGAVSEPVENQPDDWAKSASDGQREHAGDLYEPPSEIRAFDFAASDNEGDTPAWLADSPQDEPRYGGDSQGVTQGPDVTAPIGSPGWPSESTMQMPRLAGERPAPSRDFRIASEKRRTSRRSIVLGIVFAVVVVVAALLAAGFALGVIGGKPVPDVTGMTEADARSLLEGEGFSVRSTKVKSDGTEGLVLIMDPGAGSRAPEGSEVVIHIATARFVPDVVGRTRDEAQSMLDQEGFENIRIETKRSEGEEGIVLTVSPESGTRAKGNAEIVLTVSEAYKVPDIAGMGLDEAIEAIRDAELEPEVVYIDTDQFPEGTIIGTNPQANTKVSPGSAVSISVSRMRGIELVALTEELLSQGSTVNVGGIDYQIESLASATYQGDDMVAFTATGRPFVTFFGERLFPSTSQTISGTVVWTSNNEVESIY